MPVDDVQVVVWCAISVLRKAGIHLYEEMNSERYVRLIPFNHSTENEKIHGNFAQDRVTVHTANNSTNALAEVLGERMLSLGLWPVRSTDLNSGPVP